MMRGWHIGRSWPDAGTPLEDECPCPQEPCGLVAWDRIDPSCEQHKPTKTIRASHRADECSGLSGMKAQNGGSGDAR